MKKGLQFNITYDSSVSQAPAGFEAAFAAAAQFYSSEFSDPITLNIHVGYGEVNGQALNAGNLGQSEFTNGRFYAYTQLEAALAADATSADDRAAVASLPATDPTNGGSFLLTRAEQKALGLLSGSDTSVDGYIGLSSADNFTFDPNNRAVAGEYDAIGVFEHEISEIMGRYGSLGQNFGNNVYEPLDLFRYSSPGVRDLAYGPGNFSINGQTLLTAFNDPDNGGDPGDWIPSLQGDSFGDGYQGVAGLVTPTDIRVMDILGYNLAPSANITFQNTDGSVGIWNMNGLNIVTTAIPANPGTSWHVIGNGDFAGAGKPHRQRRLRWRRQTARHPVSEHRRQRRHLGDERPQSRLDRHSGQPRHGLARYRYRRLQWRRHIGHPVSEHRRQRWYLGDERFHYFLYRNSGQPRYRLAG